MNLDIVTTKIVSDYLKNGKDLNESIAKYAEEHKCNIEQTKRLVEKVNQETFLTKFAQDGSQVFDIADYNKVKKNVQEFNNSNNSLEKKAMEKIEINYSKQNVYSSIEKNASEFSLDDLNKAIKFCEDKIVDAMEKTASSFKNKKYEYNFESMEKLAEDFCTDEQKIIDHYTKIKENLLEKKAGFITGLAKGVSSAALKTGGKTIGFVAKAPLKRGLLPLAYSQAAISGAKKATPEMAQVVSNVGGIHKVAEEEIDKTAGVEETLVSKAGVILREAAPYMLATGAIMGAAAISNKTTGLVGRMYNARKLNQSFNDIMEANKDLKQIPQARAYFDVIARHAPDLAADPLVAPQLLRQFDAFGGVDLNTVGKLREIQNEGSSKPTPSMIDFGTLGNALKGAKMPTELESSKHDLKLKKFNYINDIANANPTFSSEKKFKIAPFTEK